MSRAYRLQVARTVERLVVVDDAVCTDLDLLPLLPRERLSVLLTEELERRGFDVEDGVARRSSEEGVAVEVDVATARVSVRSQREEQVAHTATRRSLQDGDERREQLEGEAQAEATARVERDAARIEHEATEALEATVRDMKDELDRIVHAVTAAALKEKAASLGEITELSEDPETGELTIKVKV